MATTKKTTRKKAAPRGAKRAAKKLAAPKKNGARKPVITVAAEPDQKIISGIEAELVVLNQQMVQLELKKLDALNKIVALNKRYNERIRAAGSNAGLDMDKNWHFDVPSMTFHPRP